MSEVLLDTLVRTVEALEKKTKEIQDQVNGLPDHTEPLKNIDSRLETAEAEIKDLPNKIFMPLPEITFLTDVLQKHSKLLSIPLKQDVHHEHHLSKPIVACIFLSLAILGLLFLEYSTWLEADKRKENDLKYRYLKVFQPAEGKEFLHSLDSQYTGNPEQFRTEVIHQEKIELDSFEDFKRMREKQQEINDLQEKWNRKPNRKSK